MFMAVQPVAVIDYQFIFSGFSDSLPSALAGGIVNKENLRHAFTPTS